ncbi:PaaX family transcriptional regulator C-terminal domain-containing protein [Streptomyces sp. NBC_01314]|uniref:PaaX family transcriptional regulator C-terminal domain-containing protein n=1 Tax=Streptomyces sp. NBC_01314 TaxID=2903821 RepID=UPI003088C46F|nr:PaaX domain-containing protein, C- domain protein [Streptomyces sp. NBC_01314]
MQTNVPGRPTELELRPLSARSVVLSLLLGMHPPELPVKDLVGHVEAFGVAGSTLRAALSRMVSAGDLRRADAVYRLSDRLLDRQRRQDASVHPETRPWNGDWEMVVVTTTGRRPADRADLRTRLTALRLAELREGVWLRPANLRPTRPPNLGPMVQHFTGRPDQATGGMTAEDLSASLWPLEAWAATAEALLAHIERNRLPADRFTALAAAVRHLLADPVLPSELLPERWPGPELRAAYTAYRRELIETVLGRTD